MLRTKFKAIAVTCVTSIASFGCASSDYLHYANTQKEIQVAHAMAEAERYKAMAAVASNGDSTTKVAAMFALQGVDNRQNQNGATHLAPPKSPWELAREWIGIVLPVAVQAYGINANKQIAVTQSNNSRDVAVSTNQTFATMNGQTVNSGTAGVTAIQNTATAAFNGLTTMGTTLGNVATVGFTANQNIAQSGLTSTQTVAQSGITGVQNTATAGLTAVQGAATAGITGVQGTATNAITALTPP